MTRYLVVYEKTATNYGAFSPDLPGCFATGDTLEDTRRLMREAIASHIDTLRAEGLPVPEGRGADDTAAGAEVVEVA